MSERVAYASEYDDLHASAAEWFVMLDQAVAFLPDVPNAVSSVRISVEADCEALDQFHSQFNPTWDEAHELAKKGEQFAPGLTETMLEVESFGALVASYRRVVDVVGSRDGAHFVPQFAAGVERVLDKAFGNESQVPSSMRHSTMAPVTSIRDKLTKLNETKAIDAPALLKYLHLVACAYLAHYEVIRVASRYGHPFEVRPLLDSLVRCFRSSSLAKRHGWEGNAANGISPRRARQYRVNAV